MKAVKQIDTHGGSINYIPLVTYRWKVISSFNSTAHKNNFPNAKYRARDQKCQENSYLGLDLVNASD
jgi:hypothetical protein